MKPNLRTIITLSAVAVVLIGVAIMGIKHKHGGNGAPISAANSPAKGSSEELTHPALSHSQPQKAEQASAASNSSTPASPQAKDGVVAALPNVVNPVPGAPALPEQTCFIENFRHKPMSGHSDEEACSRHKNLFKLSHANVNPAHVCVRVNGTPVKFERKGDEILIGSIAGPKAKVTVSYCSKKSDCAELAKEDCTVPKDEFMEALGGDGADTVAQWDNGDSAQGAENAKLSADVKKELADIDDMNSNDNDRAPAQAAVFKDWIRDEAASACGKKPQS